MTIETIGSGLRARLSVETAFGLLPAQMYPRSAGPDNGELFFWLAVAVLAIGVVCAGAFAASRCLHHRRRYNHPRLFRDLCATHEIDRNGRALLGRIAAQCRLSQPARMFVDPRWIDSAVRSGAVPTRSEDLEVLRQKLFGPPPEKKPAKPKKAKR